MLLPRRRRDPVGAAADDFFRFRANALPLQLITDQPTELERLLAGEGLDFATRVFDFGMMDYRLAGGGVHRLAGRESALFAYLGADGRRLVCEMYRGTIDDLPPPFAEREVNGIRFRIYRREDVTLVFWPESSMVCVLATDADQETAIGLAAAKAVRV
jgi:hypothetical protein